MEIPETDDDELLVVKPENRQPEARLVLDKDSIVKLKTSDENSADKTIAAISLELPSPAPLIRHNIAVDKSALLKVQDVSPSTTESDNPDAPHSVFDRSEPMSLYLNRTKARVLLLFPIFLSCLILLFFSLIENTIAPYAMLPFAAPLAFSIATYAVYSRMQLKPVLTIDRLGIAIKVPLVNGYMIHWEDLETVKVTNRGAESCVNFQVLESSRLNAKQRGIFEFLLWRPGSSIQVASDMLPISAEEVLAHVAAYADIYGKHVTIVQKDGAETMPVYDKIRWQRTALFSAIATMAVLTIFYIGTQTLHNQYRQTLEHNMLADLKNGDLYSGM